MCGAGNTPTPVSLYFRKKLNGTDERFAVLPFVIRVVTRGERKKREAEKRTRVLFLPTVGFSFLYIQKCHFESELWGSSSFSLNEDELWSRPGFATLFLFLKWELIYGQVIPLWGRRSQKGKCIGRKGVVVSQEWSRTAAGVGFLFGGRQKRKEKRKLKRALLLLLFVLSFFQGLTGNQRLQVLMKGDLYILSVYAHTVFAPLGRKREEEKGAFVVASIRRRTQLVRGIFINVFIRKLLQCFPSVWFIIQSLSAIRLSRGTFAYWPRFSRSNTSRKEKVFNAAPFSVPTNQTFFFLLPPKKNRSSLTKRRDFSFKWPTHTWWETFFSRFSFFFLTAH